MTLPMTSPRKKLMVVIGTRPEAIKLAPVVAAIQASSWAECELVLTGQHKELIDPLVEQFALPVRHNLQAMRHDQALAPVTARILEGLDQLIVATQPHAIIGQGDTVSVLAASMAAFFRQVPFAHVEAGLRTGNLHLPYPEEMNRVLTSRMSRWHFAPTDTARGHLLREGVPEADVFVTGNTVIDALQMTLRQAVPALPCRPGREFILITAHRRENHGQPMQDICNAIASLADRRPGLDFIYPVHPNPRVREVAHARLSGRDNVLLIEPCDYPVFCHLMSRARLILSDSGGVQEEAPALGKPVLVLRQETERPEAVQWGCNRLVGTTQASIEQAVDTLLSDAQAYARMAAAGSPYGDGEASQRVLRVLEHNLLFD
jgi:UDP-N-acetylglucosamine 2-epimerase (non-hydrolysing)